MHSFFYNKTKESILFPDFFSIYLDEFDSELEVLSKENIKIIKFKGVYEYLYETVFSYSIRSLVHELHIYKNNNLLIGETSKERFIYFEEIIKSETFIKSFYEKYPVLKSFLKMLVTQTASYVFEIINNFEKDRNEIQRKFKIELKSIVDIKLGKGDTHNDGKSVAIIETDCAKIAYKPRSLSSHIVFENIISWINSTYKLKCNLKSLKVIDYNNYGWQEFISYNGCKNHREVENYYYRSGCYLAVFYVLGTNDIHYENVIANGEYPYFIDLETLMGIYKPGMLDSVLTTGFIPNKSLSSFFDVDLSGLCGNMQTSSKLTTISIINPLTDEMIIENQPSKIMANNNIVKLNDEIVRIEKYTHNFISGFQDTIELIINSKESFIGLVENQYNKSDKFRQLIRHTRIYGEFLIAASYPQYLSSEEKHIELFKMLYNSSEDELKTERICHEVSSLLKWEIPYYYSYYDSKNLLSDNIVVQKDYFETTIKESFCNRIKNLNNNVKNFEIDIIKKSLFTIYEDCFNYKELNKIKFSNISKEINKEIIMKIAESISENALDLKENEDIAFLINIIDNDRVLLSCMNFNFYEGGGIIWLFACIGKLFKNNYYESIYVKLLDSSILAYEHYNMKQVSNKKISAFFGIGSLMYLYYNISILYNNNCYYKEFENIAKEIIEYDSEYLKTSTKSMDYDFVNGISGILVLAVKIYLNEENELMKKIVDKYANYLVEYINKSNLNEIGLARGLSGYSLALIMIYKVKKEDMYLNLAKELINKENSIYFKLQSIDKIKTSWSEGESGMLLVRNEVFKIEHNENILAEILKYLKVIITKGFYDINSMSLYDGIYGNIEIVNQIINDINETNKIITHDKVKELESKLVNCIDDIQLGLKNNFILDTFMNGSSGIAYSKLRQLYPQLPSILSLDVMCKSNNVLKK